MIHDSRLQKPEGGTHWQRAVRSCHTSPNWIFIMSVARLEINAYPHGLESQCGILNPSIPSYQARTKYFLWDWTMWLWTADEEEFRLDKRSIHSKISVWNSFKHKLLSSNAFVGSWSWLLAIIAPKALFRATLPSKKRLMIHDLHIFPI